MQSEISRGLHNRILGTRLWKVQLRRFSRTDWKGHTDWSLIVGLSERDKRVQDMNEGAVTCGKPSLLQPFNCPLGSTGWCLNSFAWDTRFSVFWLLPVFPTYVLYFALWTLGCSHTEWLATSRDILLIAFIYCFCLEDVPTHPFSPRRSSFFFNLVGKPLLKLYIVLTVLWVHPCFVLPPLTVLILSYGCCLFTSLLLPWKPKLLEIRDCFLHLAHP